MGVVTVQVRGLESEVQEVLSGEAARRGLSMSEFLRRELARMAQDIEVQRRADELNAPNRFGFRPDFFDGISTEEIVSWIREERGNRSR